MSTSGHPGDAPNIRYIPAKTVAEIKINAKDDISKEARGFAAVTLIRTARAQMLAAKEQEGKGNLRAAFASYIKAATLTKMALDSPEYVQEAKDKGTLIRMELDDFLKVRCSFRP
jgi:ubiquitin carboxyl-terminal hydrolase 8